MLKNKLRCEDIKKVIKQERYLYLYKLYKKFSINFGIL